MRQRIVWVELVKLIKDVNNMTVNLRENEWMEGRV